MIINVVKIIIALTFSCSQDVKNTKLQTPACSAALKGLLSPAQNSKGEGFPQGK